MRAMKDGERAAAQYDAMAAEYTTDNDGGIFNSLYERPAMLAMVGDVDGLRVLDIGCGAGQLSQELVARGATVTGIDVSSAMVALAEDRHGDIATFVAGDISDPLPFETGSFDVVVASLVMHYLEDWTPVFREIGRVLTDQGSMSFSTHHPTMDWKLFSHEDYFAKQLSTDTWIKGGKPFDVTVWRRPLADISAMLHAAGFVIDLIDEPMPADSLAETAPDTNQYLRTNPHFLFVRIIPRPGGFPRAEP